MGKKEAVKKTSKKVEDKPKDEKVVEEEPPKKDKVVEEEPPKKDDEKVVEEEPSKDEKASDEDAEEVETKESEEVAEETTEDEKPTENGAVNGDGEEEANVNGDTDEKEEEVNGSTDDTKKEEKRGRPKKKTRPKKGEEVKKKKDEKKKPKNEDEKRGRPKKTEEEKKKDEEEAGESAEDEEPPPGLYDLPVPILTEKRSKKCVEKYIGTHTPDSVWYKNKNDDDVEEVDWSEGSGVPLKQIPFVKYQITQLDNEDLVVLHRLMYGRKGKLNELKKNVFAFQGYPFDESAAPYKAALNLAHRLTRAGFKFLNDMLGLEVSKDGQKMEDDLMEFLREPKDLGVEIPANVVISPKKSTRKPGKRKSKTKGLKKGYAYETSESDAEDEEEEEEDEGKSKKKGKYNLKVKAPGRKSSGRAAKRKAAASDSSDSSEDEPLVKKKPSKAPTNTIIKKDIAALLKKADLETVTMKNIVREIYEKYPQFDLTSRKEFIKKTVKEML